ncbi:EscU/YscU/HrcU family type III secretion system export apparatus switch protein [Acetobacter sp. AN02]|uniref:EscU/YscU/HrcU family type III secretion system export apparatus switch protein n=1 Tax=Acetobacter sp. AN02 TaxID=2894186 RepID=UPI00243450F5|nr:EscU/YscU/HrcU family type III secretion system export apparatus switch protein [Acetobacter sp. AN02]MDG6095087.1 EscU/YscU/HrcU family type III secretion system export apparatus switch protein [Acetobacter sp. AN02]
MAEGEDRTEAPTGRKLEEARKEGNIAQSKELHLLSGLVCAALCLTMTFPHAASDFVRKMGAFISDSGTVDTASAGIPALFHLGTTSFIALALPVLAAAAAGSLATSLLQSGFLIRPEALIPNFGKLNPLKGVKRIFGANNLVEAIKSIGKLVCFCIPLYGIIHLTLTKAEDATVWRPERLATELFSFSLHAIWAVLIVQTLFVVLDEAWTRYHRMQGLRMSRHDIKEETKQSDSDPHVKARQKQIRLRNSRKRLREAVSNTNR